MRRHFKNNKEKVDYLVATDITLKGKEFKAIKDIKFTENKTVGVVIADLVKDIYALTKLTAKQQERINNLENKLNETIERLGVL